MTCLDPFCTRLAAHSVPGECEGTQSAGKHEPWCERAEIHDFPSQCQGRPFAARPRSWFPATETNLDALADTLTKLGVIAPERVARIIADEHLEPAMPSGEVRMVSETGGEKGTKLARFDLIPPRPLLELAVLYGKGGRKYADRNWERGYPWHLSFAAMQRHANAWHAGQDLDECNPTCVPECWLAFRDGEQHHCQPGCELICLEHTGSPHLAAIAWHALALLEFADTHPEYDDRPSRCTCIEVRALGEPDPQYVAGQEPCPLHAEA